jgi:hypothetical protein
MFMKYAKEFSGNNIIKFDFISIDLISITFEVTSKLFRFLTGVEVQTEQHNARNSDFDILFSSSDRTHCNFQIIKLLVKSHLTNNILRRTELKSQSKRLRSIVLCQHEAGLYR